MRYSLVWIGCVWCAVSVGCADVASKAVAVTYADGYAAPGESATVVINTRFSLRGEVSHVAIAASPWHETETTLFHTDEAGGYGMHLTTKTRSSLMDMARDLFVGDSQHPQLTVSIPVPETATDRGRVPVKLQVSYVRALAAGSGQFETEHKQEVLEVPVTVVAAGNEWPIRLRDAAWQFGVGVLLTAAYLIVQKKAAAMRVPDLLQFAVMMGWVYGLWRYSSEPLSSVLGLVQTGYRALAWIALATIVYMVCQSVAKALQPRRQPVATNAEQTDRAAA